MLRALLLASSLLLLAASAPAQRATVINIAPGASFDTAYHQAQPGDTVLMAGGNYGTQSITADPSKDSATRNVVFQPAPGAKVYVGQNGFPIKGAHVTIVGLSSDSSACVTTVINPPCPSISVSYPAHNVTLDGVHFTRFYITGASFVTIQNSNFGPSYDNHGIVHADTKGNRPHDLLLRNDSIHDQLNSQLCLHTPGCESANHMGGITFNDSYNVTGRRLKFVNEQDLDMLVKPYKFNNDSLVFESSYFGPSGGFRSVSLTVTGTDCNSHLTFRENTFTKGMSVTAGKCYTGDRALGNLGPIAINALAAAGWGVAYNVASSPTSDGVHLLAGGPAIDVMPVPCASMDIDGQARPRGAQCDAGADEF